MDYPPVKSHFKIRFCELLKICFLVYFIYFDINLWTIPCNSIFLKPILNEFIFNVKNSSKYCFKRARVFWVFEGRNFYRLLRNCFGSIIMAHSEYYWLLRIKKDKLDMVMIWMQLSRNKNRRIIKNLSQIKILSKN